MHRRRLLATLGGMGAAGLAGCFGGDDAPDIPEEDVAETIVVNDRTFDPDRIHVEAGDAVEWRNEDDTRYEIVDNDINGQGMDWNLDRGRIEPGEYVRYRFEEDGIYGFHDHNVSEFRLCGAVAVGESTIEDIPSLPCEVEL